MANEIMEVRDSAIIAAEINVIKDRTKREVLSASVQIGQRLCEAKELVPYGDWEQWLHDRVDYSQSTANNLMRIYKEYGDEQITLGGTSKSQTFGNLSYSQAIALFALPADDRETFVRENNVEDMSARQLQEAIKAREDAEKAKAEAEQARTEAENKLHGTEKLLETAQEQKSRAQEDAKKADADKIDAVTKARAEIQKLQEELAAAAKPKGPSEAELKKIRKEIREKVEAEYKKKEEQLSLEKKTAEEKTSEIEKAYQEQLRKQKVDTESIQAAKDAAEKRLALASPDAQKFNVYFDNFQRDFNNMKSSLQNLADSGNSEIAEKLRSALKTIIGNYSNEL